MIDPLTFSLAGLAVAAVGLPIAILRGGKHLVRSAPSRVTAWTSALPPAEVLKAAVEWAKQQRVHVEAESDACVVLRTTMTAFTWGFFFPIYVSTGADGRTRVEIGITSRLFQWGPLVTRAHHKFMEGLGAPLRLSPLP